jgi:hypothetical protein
MAEIAIVMRRLKADVLESSHQNAARSSPSRLTAWICLETERRVQPRVAASETQVS